MIPEFVEVQDIWQETKDVFTMRLPWPQSKKMSPGQFNMLYAFGVGEIPISVSRLEPQSQSVLHTIRSVGAVSRALVHLRPGDVVGVRGPFGQAWPVQESLQHDVILIAGGIGLAPLRPVVDYILQNRNFFGNVTLLYGARQLQDVLFEREWVEWMQDGLIEMNVSLDSMTPEQQWDGQIGLVTNLIADAYFDPGKTLAMLCGPEIMMRFCSQKLEERGIDSSRIFVSQERNMKCAIGLCGHCQYRGDFVCKTGPVFTYKKVKQLLFAKEV